MKFSLSIISFINCAFVVSKKRSSCPRLSRVAPRCILAKNSVFYFYIHFIVLHFMSRYEIHFELMFGNLCLASWFSSASPVVPTPFVEMVLTTFLHCIVFVPLSKISWLYLCMFTSGRFVLFCWTTCWFFHHYYPVLIAVAL